MSASASSPKHPARKLLTYVKKLFKWAINRKVYGLPYASPCSLIEPKELLGKFKPRTRILSDEEIALVWSGSAKLGYPFGPMVRLLLLTGQRRDEVAGARWSEIDVAAGRLTIPPERMKQEEAHSVPLGDMAWELIEKLPRFAGDCLFTTTAGARPVSGFSKAKARLDDIIAAMRAVVRDGEGVLPEEQDRLPNWRLHDLRRTVRSKLSELGVTTVVAEMVIGHKQQGILGVYDLYKYDKEKKDALQRWEGALRAILEPPPANVVQLRQATG